MAIKSSGGPPKGLERIGRALSALPIAAPEGLALAAEAGGAAGPAMLSRPLPVYGADLEALRSLADRKAGLEGLRQTGWRYLVLDESEVQAADLVGRRKHPTLHVGGDLAARITEAGKLAEDTALEHIDYEPRLVDLGMLDASLLWLKSRDPQEDLFFTLDYQPRKLGRDQLLQQLGQAAARKLDSFESDRTERDEESEAGG